MRILAGRGNADIRGADQFLRGKDRAKTAGKNDHGGNGVGGRIGQPALLEGFLLESLGQTGIDNGVASAHGAASSDTVGWVGR